MKIFNFSVLAGLFICVTQIYAIGFHCAEHVIFKNGQTCDLITYGPKKLLRTKDINVLNPLIDCSKPFTENIEVCIFPDSYYSSLDFNYDFYEIQEGDVCETIATKLSTQVDILERFNGNILDCDRIEELVGIKIQYRADGDYNPIFENSTEIRI